MNCVDAKKLVTIDFYEQGNRHHSDALQLHLRACQGCRDYRELLPQVQRMFHRDAKLVPPRELLKLMHTTGKPFAKLDVKKIGVGSVTIMAGCLIIFFVAKWFMHSETRQDKVASSQLKNNQIQKTAVSGVDSNAVVNSEATENELTEAESATIDKVGTNFETISQKLKKKLKAKLIASAALDQEPIDATTENVPLLVAEKVHQPESDQAATKLAGKPDEGKVLPNPDVEPMATAINELDDKEKIPAVLTNPQSGLEQEHDAAKKIQSQKDLLETGAAVLPLPADLRKQDQNSVAQAQSANPANQKINSQQPAVATMPATHSDNKKPGGTELDRESEDPVATPEEQVPEHKETTRSVVDNAAMSEQDDFELQLPQKFSCASQISGSLANDMLVPRQNVNIQSASLLEILYGFRARMKLNDNPTMLMDYCHTEANL